jgi:hypothetical protein
MPAGALKLIYLTETSRTYKQHNNILTDVISLYECHLAMSVIILILSKILFLEVREVKDI